MQSQQTQNTQIRSTNHISYGLVFGFELNIDSVVVLAQALNTEYDENMINLQNLQNLQNMKNNSDLIKISELLNAKFTKHHNFLKVNIGQTNSKMILGYYVGKVEYDLLDIHNSYETLIAHNKYYRSKLDDLLDIWESNKQSVLAEIELLTNSIIRYCEVCEYDPTKSGAVLHEKGITLNNTYYPGDQDILCCKFFKID